MEGVNMSESEKIMLPEVMVIAGPNGSGKSTITRMAKIVGEYINADEIKKPICALIWKLRLKQKNCAKA